MEMIPLGSNLYLELSALGGILHQREELPVSGEQL
jgi:hypothetical protein